MHFVYNSWKSLELPYNISETDPNFVESQLKCSIGYVVEKTCNLCAEKDKTFNFDV